MDQKFYDAVEANPVIAAVKDDKGLENCLNSSLQVVFILYGDICTIPGIVSRIKDAGKIAMVHMDLLGGLSAKDISVDYIHQYTRADGIISTRPNLVMRAKELHMYNILRLFVIDSMALSEVQKLNVTKPDFVEILPGIIPDIIKEIHRQTKVPILAGGLIRTRQNVLDALNAGAMAISATNEEIWKM
jgi:glycerol uptake operon antiterminator